MAEEYVGQTRDCTHCGKAVYVAEGGSVVPERKGWFWPDLSSCSIGGVTLFFLLIIGCDTIGMGISLLLPAVQSAREAARRMQCTNQLKGIGLAIQQYQLHYGCFPPAFIPDENGKPKHSWRVLILPFLDQEALYREYRFDEPWDGPNNRRLADRMPRVYLCPSRAPPGYSQTSYAMIVGPHAFSDGPTGRTIKDIKNDPAKTIMLAEATRAEINWLEPRDLSTESMAFEHKPSSVDQPSSKTDISSEHPGTYNVLFYNGEVRNLSATIDRKTLEAMLTIDGGEKIEGVDF